MEKKLETPLGYTREEYERLLGAQRGIKNIRYIPTNASVKLIAYHLRNELCYHLEILVIEERRRNRLLVKS